MDESELREILEPGNFGEQREEKEILDALPKIIPKDTRVIFDIGASIGQYTYFINQILEGVTIFSIEADPLRYKILKANCEEWQKSGKNKIIPLHYALYDHENTHVDFLITNSSVSGAIFFIENRHGNTGYEKVRVQTTTLDTLVLPYLGETVFIKMDIEGGEFRSIVNGARDVLHKHNNLHLLIEIHPWGDTELQLFPEHLLKVMSHAGYRPRYFKKHFIFTKQGRSIGIYFWNTLFGQIFKARRKMRKMGLIK
jgi:FkbM family methyltransferase